MSLPRRLVGGLRSVRASATALVPALVLTLAACAAVHEGPAGVDAAVDQPAATDATSTTDATDDSPRGSVVDSASGDDAPPIDAGEACTDGGNCLIGCGNGKLDPGLGEVCDDGNSVSGDGCSSNCTTVEKDYACPQPGEPCVYLVKCGDGRLGGKETCDDGNVIDNDGCSATCQKEAGWDCGKPGTACTAHCGDGVLIAAEQCEPPNAGQGCSAGCELEPGCVCDPPPATPDPSNPATCHKTVCGDGMKEGTEACDDSNTIDGDGCAATCTLEPDCSTGACASKCGDGIKLAPEECDDGNARDGDGCSKACTLEMGFACDDSSSEPPEQLNLRVTYRDFISFPTGRSTKHPDFECFGGTRSRRCWSSPCWARTASR